MSKIIIDMPNAKLKDAVEKKLAKETKYRGNGLADPWKCPDCKDTVTDFPALSRKDNETEICSDCGTREALEDYYGLPLGSTLESNGKDIAYKIRKALVRL